MSTMGIRLSQEQKAAAIEAVADARGVIAVDALWKAARAGDHPLHSLYEWDTNLAAIEHWRYVSRKIIASCHVTVIVNHREVVIPRYVRDPDVPAGEQAYIMVTSLLTDTDRARRELTSELARAEAALKRALVLAQAFGLVEDLEEMLERIAVIRDHFRSDGSKPVEVHPAS